MPVCANCVNKPCQKGTTEGAPLNCPSLTYSPEKMLALYSKEERRMAYASALVEAEGYCKTTRIEEIMDYAYKLGYKYLGLAFCAGLSSEAQIFTKILIANGFQVESVCCKNCCISKKELGITQEQQAHPERPYEGMCNPAGQALILDDAGCELVVLLGLCVGHDTLFIRHCKAPCTVLATKDRSMGNNALGAIYTASGYMNRQYYFIEKKYGKD